jgi:hypothetical protein
VINAPGHLDSLITLPTLILMDSEIGFRVLNN